VADSSPGLGPKPCVWTIQCGDGKKQFSDGKDFLRARPRQGYPAAGGGDSTAETTGLRASPPITSLEGRRKRIGSPADSILVRGRKAGRPPPGGGGGTGRGRGPGRLFIGKDSAWRIFQGDLTKGGAFTHRMGRPGLRGGTRRGGPTGQHSGGASQGTTGHKRGGGAPRRPGAPTGMAEIWDHEKQSNVPGDPPFIRAERPCRDRPPTRPVHAAHNLDGARTLARAFVPRRSGLGHLVAVHTGRRPPGGDPGPGAARVGRAAVHDTAAAGRFPENIAIFPGAKPKGNAQKKPSGQGTPRQEKKACPGKVTRGGHPVIRGSERPGPSLDFAHWRCRGAYPKLGAIGRGREFCVGAGGFPILPKNPHGARERGKSRLGFFHSKE